MDMLLLLMTIDKEECQTVNTQKDDNYHKISHTVKHCPLQVHSSQLKIEHLANTNDSSNLSDIFARCGRTISPLLENTLSTGTSRILSNN